MATIYDASTLLQITNEARLAEFVRVQDNYVPKALCKVNEANFSAAKEGKNLSIITLNLPAMGLTTQDTQDYLRIGLKTELETLGLKVDIFIMNGGMLRITCKW